MIKFEGKISEDCRQYMIKRNIKSNAITGLIAGIGSGITFVILAFSVHNLFLCGIAVSFLAMIALPFAEVSKKDQETYIPEKIYIDSEDEIIDIDCKRGGNEYCFEMIKRVIDCGAWYDVRIAVGFRETSFSIQKNLITDGTLEEFERLFEDKIQKAEEQNELGGRNDKI